MALIRRQPRNGEIFLDLVEEVYDAGAKRGKVKYIKTLGKERPVRQDPLAKRKAVVWLNGRTLGSITVHADAVLGHFPDNASGHDAILPCEIVEAGKFRHGAPRWWCRTHQVHWGTTADIRAAADNTSDSISCSNATHPVNYVLDPFVLDPNKYPGGIGVWVSLPPALNTTSNAVYDVNIHVHAREEFDGQKVIDGDRKALQLAVAHATLFDSPDMMDKINITPPAAWSFVMAFENGLPLDCLMCTYCSEPHLDLGDFAANPHRKHFCANCGRDSNWSKEAIVSNPLKRLFDVLTINKSFTVPSRSLNLDEYKDHKFEIWSSTPALVWTVDRPQERGIHVHMYNTRGKRIIDDTFGEVILDGAPLMRNELLAKMVAAASEPLQDKAFRE